MRPSPKIYISFHHIMTADNMMKNNKIYMISSSHLGPSNHRRDEDDGGGRGGGSAMVTAVVSGVMAVAAQSGAGIARKAPTGNKTRGTVAIHDLFITSWAFQPLPRRGRPWRPRRGTARW
jgi:hypothetical protein